MPTNPLHIPLRTSSADPRAGNSENTRSSRTDRNTRSMHKASKILGTTDLAFDNDYHRRPDERTSRSAGYLNATDAHQHEDADATLQVPSLRLQSSSPVLRNDYKGTSDSAPPLVQLSRKLHLTGSSSGLHSRFSSRETSAEPENRDATNGEQNQEGGLNPAFQKPKGPMKESKRKTRPPRIDLSLLFPKPQPTSQTSSTNLLSPQRMVTSPSAISFTSEITAENSALALKMHKSESRLTGKKLTKLRPRALSRPEQNQQPLDSVVGSLDEQPPPQTPSWNNASLERTVRTTDMDMALVKNLGGIPTPRSPERAFKSQFKNFHMRGREHLQPSDARSFVSARSEKSAHSSQGTLRDAVSAKSMQDGPEYELARLKLGLHNDLSRVKGDSMSKKSSKSSKSTFKNSDLNTSSVLCLSSSEDEDDGAAFKRHLKPGKNKRDSVSTYGGYEAEICTAAAAHTIRGTLKSVDRPSSSNTQKSRSSSKHLQPPMPTGNTRSRRSSGIPMILEPGFAHNEPVYDKKRAARREPALSQKELNRRSRVMAVTRQEERLLEVMRTREGKITPSIFNENMEQDHRSVISNFSGPSRDSYYRSDTSFLRLSGSFPPASARTSQATATPMAYKEPETWTPQGTGFDFEDKTTTNPTSSPQASVGSSKDLPSPATSATSPITPTLPIHRFSPLSQKPPPSLPPPPVPDLQRNHSRRRTDSSGAIVLEDSVEAPKETGEYPVWALGWNNESNNLTAVH
ncbi:hypothetical protein BDV18DRAFT_134534 [Aspergillus unguis]